MNMTHTTYNRNMTIHKCPHCARRSYLLNRLADGILCAASTMGIVTAFFFLLTM